MIEFDSVGECLAKDACVRPWSAEASSGRYPCIGTLSEDRPHWFALWCMRPKTPSPLKGASHGVP